MLSLMRSPAKYVQGKNALADFAKETEDLGKKFLFICSRSGRLAVEDTITDSLKLAGGTARFETFGGISSYEEIDKMAALVREENFDAVVGVGGGSAIDTAKAAAYKEGKPVVIVPTIAATDAPCTAISVIYNNDGSFDKYQFYPRNPDCVIMDTSVIIACPPKFVVAGMGDALATYYEARSCHKVGAPSLEGGKITNATMALCKLCRDILFEDGYNALVAAQVHQITPAFENVIEANTFLSGVGADNGGCAVAHAVYNGFTALEECESVPHGNLVAFGTIVQLILEHAPEEELEEVIAFCLSVGLPTTLADVNVTDPSRVAIAAKKACAPGETSHVIVGGCDPEKLEAAIFTADALCRAYQE